MRAYKRLGASMRPRQNRLGNLFSQGASALSDSSFNEAEAKSPRKSLSGTVSPEPSARFNEAEAKSPRKSPIPTMEILYETALQ